MPNVERKHRLNREIMAPTVRLNGVNNEPLGIVSIGDVVKARLSQLEDEARTTGQRLAKLEGR